MLRFEILDAPSQTDFACSCHVLCLSDGIGSFVCVFAHGEGDGDGDGYVSFCLACPSRWLAEMRVDSQVSQDCGRSVQLAGAICDGEQRGYHGRRRDEHDRLGHQRGGGARVRREECGGAGGRDGLVPADLGVAMRCLLSAVESQD